MEQTKTKKALIMSVLSMVLCIAMLIGMTFAWFTDTASTGVNKIQAGNLDVQLLMRNSASDGTYKDISNATEAIFGTGDTANEDNQATLWEPGKTQVAYLAVRNAGNLALKYNIKLNVVDKGLIGALDYVIVPQTTLFGENQTYDNTVDNWDSIKKDAKKLAAGSFTAASNGCLDEIANDPTKVNETEYFALVVHMDEAAGNVYQDKSVDIDVTVVATQKDAESDSNGNDYDKNATYPAIASNQNEANDAITNATAKDVTINLTKNAEITLDNDIANEGAKSRDITFVGDGTQTVDVVEKAVSAEGGQLNYQRGSTFTFENLTVQAGEGNFDGIVCDELTYKNCTINGKLTLYGKATFINCTFENTMENQYSIWTWGGTDVTVKDCTFNTNGKAILLYGQATAAKPTNLVVDNCKFNDRNNGSAGKAAIEIGNDYNATYTLTVNKTTVNGFANGKNTGSKLWANKNSMDAAHLTVTIDGTKVQ